jgi:hypothetical protein
VIYPEALEPAFEVGQRKMVVSRDQCAIAVSPPATDEFSDIELIVQVEPHVSGCSLTAPLNGTFGVDDHPVHVKDDGFELNHATLSTCLDASPTRC